MPISRASSARCGALWFVLLCALSSSGCGLLRRPDRPLDRSQDPRIEREVAARLAAEPSLAAGGVRVEVIGAVVRLHGGVDGIGAWQCAIATSSLVSGVRSVVDYLVIGRGPRDIRCMALRPDSAVVPGT